MSEIKHKVMVPEVSRKGIGSFTLRNERPAEKEQRERTEAINKQKNEVTRLRDLVSRLDWKVVRHQDAIRDARIAIETNTNEIEPTKQKIADAKLDLADAEAKLSLMEKSQ
jgi:hypothetical protein